jgi:predicted MFS family arabinose efflux permease
MSKQILHPKIFYGWYIVGACILIMLFVGGVIDFGFTAVIEPIAKEFGWSYAQISLAASLRGLEIGLLAPLMGLLVDRWGPRRLVLGGSLLICGGLLTLSNVSSLIMFY